MIIDIILFVVLVTVIPIFLGLLAVKLIFNSCYNEKIKQMPEPRNILSDEEIKFLATVNPKELEKYILSNMKPKLLINKSDG